jgi:hypothetical protein
MAQGIVVELVHQRQQAAELAGRKADAGEPAEIVSGKIGQQSALIFTEGHFTADQRLQRFIACHVAGGGACRAAYNSGFPAPPFCRCGKRIHPDFFPMTVLGTLPPHFPLLIATASARLFVRKI